MRTCSRKDQHLPERLANGRELHADGVAEQECWEKREQQKMRVDQKPLVDRVRQGTEALIRRLVHEADDDTTQEQRHGVWEGNRLVELVAERADEEHEHEISEGVVGMRSVATM